MSRRLYQYLGLALGLVVFVGVGVVASDRNYLRLANPGPMNTGHETLSCATCHRPEIGTARQQLQAEVAYWLGRRDDWIHFATVPVDNGVCLDCHEAPDDRHPIYRFGEPRFREARAAIGADQCASCHAEHNGVRVTQPPGFCVQCHEDTIVRNDPVDIPHATLIADARWDTCLTCHDFHGNHVQRTPERMADAFPIDAVTRYLAGRGSLYTMERRWRAKTEEDIAR